MRFSPESIARVLLAQLLPALLVPGSSLAAGPAASLFPEPLHLTRHVEAGLGAAGQVLEEYYSGNRVVSVDGPRVSVADYERREVVSIDRSTKTFSVTSFEELARTARACVLPCTGQQAGLSAPARPSPQLLPGQQEKFEIRGEHPDDDRTTVTIDQSMALSREAFEVIVGSAYPNAASRESDFLTAISIRTSQTNTAGVAQPALRSQTSQRFQYGLPVEQITTAGSDGETTIQNRVVRVGREAVPEDFLNIPAGYQRVASTMARHQRELDELDKLPSTGALHP